MSVVFLSTIDTVNPSEFDENDPNYQLYLDMANGNQREQDIAKQGMNLINKKKEGSDQEDEYQKLIDAKEYDKYKKNEDKHKKNDNKLNNKGFYKLFEEAVKKLSK